MCVYMYTSKTRTHVDHEQNDDQRRDRLLRRADQRIGHADRQEQQLYIYL